MGLLEVILTEASLVQCFLNWETEAQMVEKRTELEGSRALS